MVEKLTMYPTKVEQPNRNKDSGLQGKCFDAVRRNGTVYNVSCVNQKDPKYHHEWSNAEELLKGKTIQCGRPSTKMCSHATYYGIKGYRNTCPIAGVNGTYTQPATLRLFFDLSKKKISPAAKIEKIEISFEHRCVGVDVANGKEYTTWGPNFNGFKAYPNRKPLTIKVGNEKKSSTNNPPLGSKFNSTGVFTFKDVKYTDLTEKGIDIIYGNNLETNPGNIYLRNLQVSIYYTDETAYLTGTQNSKSLYLSEADNCKTSIKVTLEAGYKQGNKKMDTSKAPKDLRKDIVIKAPKNVVVSSPTYDSKNKRKVTYTITDNSMKEGDKKVKFSVKGTKQSISIEYKAIKRNKPDISIIGQIERNTKNSEGTSIIAKNGCCQIIQAYHKSIKEDNLKYTFNSFNIGDKDNIIKPNDVKSFYEVLAGLPCGYQKIIFRRDNEPTDEALEKIIKIVPTSYKFKVTDNDKEITSYTGVQDKSQNKTLTVTYIETKERIFDPSFIIENPTHGKKPTATSLPTSELIDNKTWNTANGKTTTFEVGQYYPGDYTIKFKDNAESCASSSVPFPVTLTPGHRQYYDEIFVRGEDSTAFNYDYLVAFEGDSISEPIYVNTVKLGATFKDIKICAPKEKITGLMQIDYINLKISNTSDEDIQNLTLELNTLKENDDGNLEVTSNEWLESDGILYNFKENFEHLNQIYEDFITIKNLSEDNDYIDEEDVYIHISRLNKQSSIDLKIPFGCAKENDVNLQVLLFGQPIAIYQEGFCNDETKRFDKIHLKVYDSILTNMSITGETDLFETTATNCPEEYFETNMKYSIRNIDTNTLQIYPTTIIENDPRLIPYKYVYGKGTNEREYSIDNNSLGNIISFDRREYQKPSPIIGERIDVYVQFEEHEEIHLHQYTDYNGESLFFIQIPSTVEEQYTTEEILKQTYIEYKGGLVFNKSYVQGENYVVKEVTNFISTKDPSEISLENNENIIRYHAGQAIPLRVQLIGKETCQKNEITFRPNIKRPGEEDSLTVYYRIYNLDKNEGKLSTEFRTDSYQLIPNKERKVIYCGMKTDLNLKTNLSKVIVENQSLNRLSLALENLKRDNKEIKVSISGYNIHYDKINHKIDKGLITVEDNKIIWTIDYMEENSVITGYIDFKAENVGYNTIETSVTDFLDNLQNIKFGEDSYKCECRKGI